MIDLRSSAATRTTVEPAVATPAGAATHRLRTLVGCLAAGMILAAAFASGCGEIIWFETPSVRSAPRRVAAILDAHHDPSDHGAIPARVAAAVLATEDSRFYQDPALDPAGTARAASGELTDNPAEAGATIEIQLAKLLYTAGHSSVADQVEQVALAFKLDNRFDKEQILAMYLNAAYFGDGAYGIVGAAQRYFGLSPAQLSWGQASLLAGLLQAPSAYNPTRHLHAALRRQRQVLGRLRSVGALNATQVQRISAASLNFVVPVRG